MAKTHHAVHLLWDPRLRLAISCAEIAIIVGVSVWQLLRSVKCVPNPAWSEEFRKRMELFRRTTICYTSASIVATYAIVLNMVLPADYCGNALRGILPAYYLSKWTLYMMVTAKGYAMDFMNADTLRFKVIGVFVVSITPILLAIYLTILLPRWKFNTETVSGEEVCVMTAEEKGSTGFVALSVVAAVIVVFDIVIFTVSTIGLTTPICNPTASKQLRLESAKHSFGGFMCLLSTVVYFVIFFAMDVNAAFVIIRVDLDYLLLDMTVNFVFIMTTFWNFPCCWMCTGDSNRANEDASEAGKVVEMRRYKNSRAMQANEKNSTSARV
mmetsp:Transcript_17926/g.36194  ORF Transcript_17926/g.36194 Transcript_17926/m.36194 type:complete len:326 (+) Transcript_17926:42-1019(+)